MNAYKDIDSSGDTITIIVGDITITLENVSEKTEGELNSEANTQYGSTLSDLFFHKFDDDTFAVGTGDCTGEWWENEGAE